MTLCVIDGGHCCCQPDEGMLCPRAAALKEDAARYRWLREQFESFHDGQYPGFNFRCTVMLKPDEHTPTIDAAIDAARATQEGKS